MWSVKYWPKPGLARISARRSWLTGSVAAMTSIGRELSMEGTVPNRSASHTGGNRGPELGGTARAPVATFRKIGRHGVLHGSRGLVEAEVVEEQSSRQD